jgi:hypothetical protein
MTRTRNEFKILVEKIFPKHPLGRLSRRWENMIRMNLGEIECEVDGSGSGSFPMACFFTSCVKCSDAVTTVLV